MQLEQLSISRNSHGFDYAGIKAGALGGKIKFSGDDGSTVEVVLQPHHVESILAVVADSMVTHTRALAENLTAQIIEHTTFARLSAEAA